MWVIINKTTFGYELKACGYNKNAARYAGINEKRCIVLSMTIAGALAGLGAGLFFLSGSKEWEPLVSTALPFLGGFYFPHHRGRRLHDRQAVPQRGFGYYFRCGDLPVCVQSAV